MIYTLYKPPLFLLLPGKQGRILLLLNHNNKNNAEIGEENSIFNKYNNTILTNIVKNVRIRMVNVRRCS